MDFLRLILLAVGTRLGAATYNMKKSIVCKVNDNITSYYLRIGHIDSLLFSTKPSKLSDRIFQQGIELHQLFALSKNKNTVIQHISSRLLTALRKYQKETGLEIFEDRHVRAILRFRCCNECYSLFEEVA